jgi:hypothetical protein
MNEHEMTALMERVGEVLDPDVGVLIARGTARGRARRRRRAVGAVVTGVAGVVVVGALSYASVPDGQGAEAEDAPVASAPTPSSDDRASQAPRQFGPDPAKMGWVLGDLLVGNVTQRRAWHERLSDSSGFQAGSVLLDGAKVTVRLERTEPLRACDARPSAGECEVVLGGIVSWGTYKGSADANGSEVPRSRGDELDGVLASTATYATPDGFAITATALNAADVKDAETVAAVPVLTYKELVALVRDPVWLEDQQ